MPVSSQYIIGGAVFNKANRVACGRRRFDKKDAIHLMARLGDGMERKTRYGLIETDVLAKTLERQRKGWGNGEEKKGGKRYQPALHLD